MKKLLLLLVLIGIVYVAYNRQRVFIRNPLGSVTRDGVKEAGAQVFINYNNDVLLENDNAPMYVTLIEHGQPVGTPAAIKCIHFVVCMTDADVATLYSSSNTVVDSMSSKAVQMHEGRQQTVIALR